jgi:hypothetical protein
MDGVLLLQYTRDMFVRGALKSWKLANGIERNRNAI